MRPGSPEERLRAAVATAARLGVRVSEPRVIADGGNLLVHLAPSPIVARVATLFDGDETSFWREVLARELDVALHLDRAGVPVVLPTVDIDPGPHPAGETWTTLWTYVPSVPRPEPEAEVAAGLLGQLTAALSTYPRPLTLLGAWRNAAGWVRHLETTDDSRLSFLVEAWRAIERRLGALASEDLAAAHGDAHMGNLHPGPDGWLWIDFEDVSRMPRYWDPASFVARTYLLGEGRSFSERLIAAVLGTDPPPIERRTFGLALAARVVLSAVVNAALAQRGHGDPMLAERRVERLPELLQQLGESP